jgi:hypothetical protein
MKEVKNSKPVTVVKFEYGVTPIGAGGGVVDGYGTLSPNYGIKLT